MKGHFLIASNEVFLESNIYADKSAVVLDWLLLIGIERKQISIREVARERDVSVGLVQRVFEVLVMQGFLQTTGLRTAKKFLLSRPQLLLKSWLDNYSIVKKCKMWTYKTAFSEKQEVLKALEESSLNRHVALALHSAAEAHGYKNNNLEMLELYLLDPSIRSELEQTLLLEPQEKSYEVLLIEPYYKNLLKIEEKQKKNTTLKISPTLLTFLDLYQFPLRGTEQAEFMAERCEELKRIYGNDHKTRTRR